MIETVLGHPYMGVIVSVGAYALGGWLKRKTGLAVANPLLIATIVMVAVIYYSPLTMEQYRVGGSIITLLIVPATTVLAVGISRQWSTLCVNAIPIFAGCVIGSATSIVSIWLLCRWFGINEILTASLLPKSVTTAISIELSEVTGGVVAVTVSAVVLTGIASAILCPVLIKLLRFDNSIGNGLAMGVSGHAIGTAKALEIGEAEGAYSGIALCLSGVITSLIYMVLF